jgi:uncharacterized Zn-binding protein involved in type VI secretion
MKLVNFYRKPISVLVTVTFTILLCFWANQSPAASTVPATEKSQGAALENSNGESSGFIEQEEPEHAFRKGKKFPWLIVALVAVAGGAALYFLVLKKKNYTLTVTVGEGVTGTPAAGTSTNEKGTVVAYSYSLQSGYENLTVTLDGAAVAASGTVTMNANHALAASAVKTYILTVSRGEHVDGPPASGTYSYASGTNVPYSYAPASGYSNLEVKIDGVAAANAGTIAMTTNHSLTANLQGANIEVNSTPSGARIYMDNVDSSHTTPFTFNFPTAVTKTVLLRYSCGYKDYTQTVSVSIGQTKTVNATLDVGIKEDFTIPASSCWHPYYSAGWSTGSGNYKYNGTAPQWSMNYYSHSFSGDYTVTVKMNQTIGATSLSKGIFLGTGTSMTSNSGYLFYVTTSGIYRVYRLNSWNFVTNCCSYNLLINSTSSAITQGLNKWNTLKVIKAGTNYTFKANDVLLYSFSDATYTPGYCVLAYYCGNITSTILCDYVYLDSGAGAGSVPGLPVKNNPATDRENLVGKPGSVEKNN